MRKLPLALYALFFSSACVADEYILTPGKSAGAITAASTEADIMKVYPGAKRKLRSVGEIYFGCSTVLFEGTDKEVFVMWKNAENLGEDISEAEMQKLCMSMKLEGISYVEVWPALGADGSAPASQWKLPEGLSVGADLAQVEKANGKPVTLITSEGDMIGAVINWNKGVYDTGLVAAQMTFPDDVRTWLIKNAKNEEINSANIPADKKAKIRVEGLRMYFVKP